MNQGTKDVPLRTFVHGSWRQRDNEDEHTMMRATCIGTPVAPRPLRKWRPRALNTTYASAKANVGASGTQEFDYDLITIGAGSGGVRAARMAAAKGARVAICEMPFAAKASDVDGGVGGTCVIRGCVPKKLLVFGSHFREDFEDAKGFGWELEGTPKHNWKTLMTAKRKELDRLNGVYHRLLDGSDVKLLEGRGKIAGPNSVDVDGKVYTTKNILVSTGGRAFVPPIPGSEHGIVSDDALELEELPKKICIIGGGYIGLEFACIFNSFGSEVHLFCRQEYPLRGFDEEIRHFILEQAVEKGINYHGKASIEKIEKLEDGRFALHTNEGEEVADKIMFATGRRPNTRNIGLETVGIKTDEKTGAVLVDEFSKTNVDNVWAIGDVTNRLNLTPVALMEGMAFVKTVFDNTPTKPDYDCVPSAVFSQPPLATVGLTEEKAIEKYGDVDIYSSTFKPMKHTLTGRTEKTFMKLIVDAASQKVVGVHMAGADVAEMMQGVGVAVKMGATKQEFDQCVGIHPTSAEEFVTMRTVTREIRAPT
eukprot:scaffold764_cov363-Pavlova_lutheri.AAC.4